ncbi:MAG: MFS transporter [Gammaproteobacteria bacterium]|nr:MAG: MFS transporter [Gammaproteobacteria bacterium]
MESLLRWLLLLGLWLCYFSFGAIASSLAPLVPLIQSELELNHAAMGSIMGAWQFVYIGAAIPAGILLDRLGGTRALVIGIAFVALSSFGRAWADGYWSLLLAVMLFGIGGPIVSSGAPKVVTDIFEGSNRGLAMGIYMTGPTLGGILALTLTHSVLLPLFEQNWRSILNLWGAVAVFAGLVWFVIARMAGQRVSGFDEPASDADQATKEKPGVRQIVAITGVPLVLTMSVGVFLINHGLNNWLPEMLRERGMTATAAGYWAALPMLIGILGSLTIPRLATPERRFMILGLLCAAAAISSFLLTLSAPGATTVALLVQGLVRSTLMTVLILTLMELPGMRQEQAGTASGLFFSAAEVGGVLGPLGLGFIYDLTHGFNAGLYTLAAVSTLMLLGTFRLARLARPKPVSGL